MLVLAKSLYVLVFFFFFFQAEDGIRDLIVTGVQTCALPICVGADAPLRCHDGPGLGERVPPAWGGLRPRRRKRSGEDDAHQTYSGSATGGKGLGARLRPRSGRRTGRRPFADWLSVRGKRPPRLDGSRRADSLHECLLSEVG